MTIEKTDTLVVGGGQAGIAMSEHLGNAGIDHLVSWNAAASPNAGVRNAGIHWSPTDPAWHDRFPGLEFEDTHADAFPGKERVADYFVEYAEKIGAPIRCGVEVTEVRRNAGRAGFRVETSAGVIEADSVVAATGPFSKADHPAAGACRGAGDATAFECLP